MSRTRSTVAAVKRAEASRVATTTQPKPIGPKRPVTKKVPLHIVMRDYTLRQKIDALVDSTLHEEDGNVGDILETLISTARWLSFKINDRKPRLSIAWDLSDLAADLRRSTIAIVHSVPRNIVVTKYPEKDEGMQQ